MGLPAPISPSFRLAPRRHGTPTEQEAFGRSHRLSLNLEDDADRADLALFRPDAARSRQLVDQDLEVRADGVPCTSIVLAGSGDISPARPQS